MEGAESAKMTDEINNLKEIGRQIYVSAVDYALKHPSLPDDSFK